MRRICAGVNVGNICSIRELISGSPLRVSLIEVVCGSQLLMAFFLGTATSRKPLRAYQKGFGNVIRQDNQCKPIALSRFYTTCVCFYATPEKISIQKQYLPLSNNFAQQLGYTVPSLTRL